MLQLRSFTFNPFQENTYLISNEHRQCWIIDPGMMDAAEAAGLIKFIEKEGLKPQAIINTHAHIDHILGVDALVQKYNIPFLLHAQERTILENAGDTAKMFGFDFPGVRAIPTYIGQDQVLQLGDDTLHVLFVPDILPAVLHSIILKANG